MTIPQFPVAELRAAIEADDFSVADHLLAAHHGALVEALATVDPSAGTPAAWTELLHTQHAMLAELRGARDATSREIARLGNDHRSARTYLQQGAA